MENDDPLLTEDIYTKHLSTINGIHFTPREIDVISCLLSARRTSQIASILAIAPRTVTTHFRNVMLRLDCNSQEGIINFIEKSQKISLLRDYYASLIMEAAFKKSLCAISKLNPKKITGFIVVYWNHETLKNNLLHYLKDHLDHAGVSADIQESQSNQNVKLDENQTLLALIERRKEDKTDKSPSAFPFIDVSGHQDYYLAVFEILKKLHPDSSLDGIIKNFEEYSEGIQSSSRDWTPKNGANKWPERETTRTISKAIGIRERRWLFVPVVLFLGLCGISSFAFKAREEMVSSSSQVQIIDLKKQEDLSVRSDLILPTESSLLHRPELLAQIDDKLKSQKGIQTIALVGPGGAGKTTLARQYAHQQKASVIWEINAETSQTLKESLEKLGQSLSKTEADKKIFKEIQQIKNPKEREGKIIELVKKNLKKTSSWILIYDNIEKFSDIQKQFPQDPVTWGQGKVILTTRDTNIENNAHIGHVVLIGDLSSTQKLALFTKIMNHGKAHPLTPSQVEETKAFLESIPPFPLDVSVAAYYLKSTNIPYAAYLKTLAEHNKDFENVQGNLLKEAGDYTKTRYGIIIFSLEHVINAHKDFRDLLLFISLLDSQNIPRDLLNQYKPSTVVDNFIYFFKKYSLLANNSFPSSYNLPTLSIHRSTQAISLAYLTKLLHLEKNKDFIKHIGEIFKNYAVKAVDKEDFLRMNLLISHCDTFLNHTNLLTDFVIASINGELGNIYIDLSNYEKAKQLLEESLVAYKKNSYESHPWFARALASLGGVHRELGNYEKAKQLLEESLVAYKKNSYESHPWFARALQLLGSVHREQGSYEKAKKLFEESIVIYRKNSYENHPWFSWDLISLGIVYRGQGKYEKAKDLLEQSLTIYRKNSLENNIWFALALGWLGDIYREQGSYERAQQLLEASAVIYRKHYLENHPWYARHLAWLGCVYRDLGHYEKAQQLLEESITIYKSHSYENHPWCAQALAGLGSIYRGLGQYDKAKNLLEHSLQIYEKTCSKYHDDTARVLRNLGQNHLLEGHIEPAEAYLHKALAIFQKNNHPEMYSVLENFSDLCIKKSNLEKNTKQSESFKIQAISYLKQALDIVKTNFPQDSPHIQRIEAKLKEFQKETE